MTAGEAAKEWTANMIPELQSFGRAPGVGTARRKGGRTYCASPDHAPRGGFLHIVAAGVRRRSVRLDRCEATRHATRLGLICLCRRLVGAYGPAAHGPDGIRPSATARNNARSGQLVGSWTRMRAMCSITRAPILIRRSRIVANSALASGSVFGIAARTPCINQNAAVWRRNRT